MLCALMSGVISVLLLQMFILQLSVQFVRCTVLRGLGLIFGRGGGWRCCITSPWAVVPFLLVDSVSHAPPSFFSPQGNKFKPQLQCWIFKLFKTWEAVTLCSNFSAWIFWRASILLCLTRPPHSPCVKWQHQETWGFSHHFGAMFQWPPPKGEALGLRRDLSLFLSDSKARTWPL